MGGEGENDADTITVAQFELAVPTGRLLDNLSSGATSNGLVNYSTIFTGGGNDFVSGVLNYGLISTGAGNDRVFARNFSTINLGDGDDLVGGFVDAITGNSLWEGGYGTDTIALGDGTYVVTQGASGLSIGGASFVDFEYICGIGQIDSSLLFNGALPGDGSVPYPTTQSLLPGTYTISNAGKEIAFALG
jgi:hypothetical protein